MSKIIIFTTRELGTNTFFSNSIKLPLGKDSFLNKLHCEEDRSSYTKTVNLGSLNSEILKNKDSESFVESLFKYYNVHKGLYSEILADKKKKEKDKIKQLKEHLEMLSNLELKDEYKRFSTIHEIIEQAKEKQSLGDLMDTRTHIFQKKVNDKPLNIFGYRCLDLGDLLNKSNCKNFITCLIKDVANFIYPGAIEEELLKTLFDKNKVTVILHG